MPLSVTAIDEIEEVVADAVSIYENAPDGADSEDGDLEVEPEEI